MHLTVVLLSCALVLGPASSIGSGSLAASAPVRVFQELTEDGLLVLFEMDAVDPSRTETDAFRRSCGGFAPLVTNCSTGQFFAGFNLDTGFLFPPCTSSLTGRSPLNAACYVGSVESEFIGPAGKSVYRCDVALVGRIALTEVECYAYGPDPGTNTPIHRCESNIYNPRTLGAPDSEGGVGDWLCVIVW